MPHAAKGVTIVRKRAKGLSKNLEKKWVFFIFSHPRLQRNTGEKNIPKETKFSQTKISKSS